MTRSILALLATAGLVAAQGVTDKIAPKGDAPATCKPAWDGKFELTVASVTSKRDIEPRAACGGTGTLVLTLADGVLLDAKSRTGYIASNFQFQFDGPAQAGAIYTAGFSVCGNGSLALGPSAVFYKCTSGDFSNLYDRSWAPQCSPVELIALPCGGNVGQGGDGQVGQGGDGQVGQGGDGQVGQGSDGQVGQGSDGQIVGTTVIQTTVVSVLADGQPQVKTSAMPIALCQITDGQAQVKTTPCASVTSAPAKTTAKPAPVSQYSDGQIQVTPGPAPPAPAPAAPAPAPPAPAPPAPAPAPAPAPVSSAPSSSAAPAKTTAAPATSASAAPSASKSSSPVSASGAGQLEMASVSALIVGLVGAIFFL